MATNTSTNMNKNDKPAAEELVDTTGWKTFGEPDLDAWFLKKEKASFVGHVIYAKSMNTDNGAQTVVFIKLAEPCKSATLPKSEDVITLEKGKILAVGISAKLSDLLYYVEHKGLVKVTCKDQIKLSGGRKMWLFDMAAHPKAVRSEKPFVAVESGGSGDDEVPFA